MIVYDRRVSISIDSRRYSEIMKLFPHDGFSAGIRYLIDFYLNYLEELDNEN